MCVKENFSSIFYSKFMIEMHAVNGNFFEFFQEAIQIVLHDLSIGDIVYDGVVIITWNHIFEHAIIDQCLEGYSDIEQTNLRKIKVIGIDDLTDCFDLISSSHMRNPGMIIVCLQGYNSYPPDKVSVLHAILSQFRVKVVISSGENSSCAFSELRAWLNNS